MTSNPKPLGALTQTDDLNVHVGLLQAVNRRNRTDVLERRRLLQAAPLQVKHLMNFLEIYNRAFAVPKYCNPEPHEPRFDYAVQWILKLQAQSILDIGSGRGGLLQRLMIDVPQAKLSSCDLANYHKLNVPFKAVGLTAIPGQAWLSRQRSDVTACLDVLEHLPKDEILAVLYHISLAAKHAVITVSNHSDVINGEELHLIRDVPAYWWRSISNAFWIADARLLNEGRTYAFMASRRPRVG